MASYAFTFEIQPTGESHVSQSSPPRRRSGLAEYVEQNGQVVDHYGDVEADGRDRVGLVGSRTGRRDLFR
ncbi:hypothetical protein ACFQ1S_15295, partial [Kibdelosporangium lantanae]